MGRMTLLRHTGVHPTRMPVASESPAKTILRQEASNDMRECVERTLHADARVPVSTYRVQMHKDFTFADAAGIAD